MSSLVFSVFLSLFSQAFALETDQFTLPPSPLVDVGPRLSSQIHNVLLEILEEQNPITDEDKLASEVHKRLGRGVLKTEVENYIDDLPLVYRFKPNYQQSVFSGVILPIPGGHVNLAPSVILFGSYIGTDKIGHFFQQGFEYYQKYIRFASAEDGFKGAVANGIHQEKSYYGIAVSGVYSNADLAANYAGLKFYLNLTRTVRIGPHLRPPMLVNNGTRWELSPDFDSQMFLAHFVSLHWNEVLNPSEYIFQKGQLRKNIQKRCLSWANELKEDFNLFYFNAHLAEYRSWFGEDYGHRLRKPISLTTECFKEDTARSRANVPLY